jgi:hypothetical protein
MRRLLARGLVRASAWLAPIHLRGRWREEWLAELDATRAGHLRRALGAPWDALSARWISRVEPPAGRWRSGWTSDLRQTVRSLQRSPGHVALVVVCLGIGLAASIAIFSIVNSRWRERGIRDRKVILRVYRDMTSPTPRGRARWVVFANPSAMISTSCVSTGQRSPASPAKAISAWRSWSRAPRRGSSARSSRRAFSVLGTEPQRGRLLASVDDRPDAPPVVVIGDYFWRTMLDARPDVVGQSLSVSGRSVTIVGVAPVRFTGIQPVDVGDSIASGLQLWLPLTRAIGAGRAATPRSG